MHFFFRILWLPALFAGLLYANTISLSNEERSYLQQKGEITMCVDPDWMPYEKIENGRHVGMAHDYTELFQEYIGIPIILIPTTSWSESIDYARARKCDIFSLAMATPERLEYMNFTKPYLSIPLVVTTRIDELFIVDIQDVLQKRLGVVKGYAFTELLKMKYPKINLVEVPSVSEGLRLVREGELFGFVGSLSSVGYMIQRDYIGELKVAGKFDERWELGIGVRNDEPMMLEIFNKAIAALDDTTQLTIMNRWIAVKYEQGIDYYLIWKIAAFVLLGTLFFTYRHYMLIRYNRMLKTLSVTDTLTGLNNRLKIDETLQIQLEMWNRYRQGFSLMIIDLDHFKQINDSYGHQVGDEVLKRMAEIFKHELRATDIAGRWGGEEFIIICPETRLEGAQAIAEKVRTSIENLEFNRRHKVTVSIGVTQISFGDDFTGIVKRADDALYEAKAKGRNRVEYLMPEQR